VKKKKGAQRTDSRGLYKKGPPNASRGTKSKESARNAGQNGEGEIKKNWGSHDTRKVIYEISSENGTPGHYSNRLNQTKRTHQAETTRHRGKKGGNWPVRKKNGPGSRKDTARGPANLQLTGRNRKKKKKRGGRKKSNLGLTQPIPGGGLHTVPPRPLRVRTLPRSPTKEKKRKKISHLDQKNTSRLLRIPMLRPRNEKAKHPRRESGRAGRERIGEVPISKNPDQRQAAQKAGRKT